MGKKTQTKMFNKYGKLMLSCILLCVLLAPKYSPWLKVY